jgi:hypothetical protein
MARHKLNDEREVIQSGMRVMQMDKYCSKSSTCLVTSTCDISKISNSSNGACVNGGCSDIVNRVTDTKTGD